MKAFNYAREKRKMHAYIISSERGPAKYVPPIKNECALTRKKALDTFEELQLQKELERDEW